VRRGYLVAGYFATGASAGSAAGVAANDRDQIEPACVNLLAQVKAVHKWRRRSRSLLPVRYRPCANPVAPSRQAIKCVEQTKHPGTN
jgi:hypothetical protein